MRKNADKLAQFIRENGINIVHARSRAPAWSAYWAAKKAGVHYMTTFHGTYGLGPWGLKKLYNRVMTYGERVIAIFWPITKFRKTKSVWCTAASIPKNFRRKRLRRKE